MGVFFQRFFYNCVCCSSNRTLVHLLERWGLEGAVVTMATDESRDRVVIEGVSDRLSSTEHTIHLWEIIKPT